VRINVGDRVETIKNLAAHLASQRGEVIAHDKIGDGIDLYHVRLDEGAHLWFDSRELVVIDAVSTLAELDRGPKHEGR